MTSRPPLPPADADDPPVGFLCRSPFEYVHIQANGDVYPCCPSKFGKTIGNLNHQTLAEVWSSPEAEEARASMLDGSHRFCNAEACEYLRGAQANGEALAPQELVAWSRAKGLLDAGASPAVANFGFDRACNLACSYCRTSRFQPDAEDERMVAAIDANIFGGSAPAELRRIVFLGEGDPFDSRLCREKLRTYDWGRHPQLRIKIQTNGLLLNPAMWRSIAASHQAIDWISVSVDAASAQTYRANRGGDFRTLRRNLAFIGNLRAIGRIDRFCVNFLVQANNFREMPDFVRLGLEMGCDQVEFQRLENWGTYTEAQYRERAVHEPFHSDHEVFLQVLSDDVLRDQHVWLLKVTPSEPGRSSVGVMSWDDGPARLSPPC